MIESTYTADHETETAGHETEKRYTFRKLGAPDLFLMMSIVKKIGLKEFKENFTEESVKNIVSAFKANGGEDTENDGSKEKAFVQVGISIGVDILDLLLGNMPKCEKEIYTLLSRVSGLPENEIKEDAVFFTEMLMDFLKKPEFPDFIKVVLKSFNK